MYKCLYFSVYRVSFFEVETESVNIMLTINAWRHFKLQLLDNSYNTRANELPAIKLII